jgi:hypothetical protein
VGETGVLIDGEDGDEHSDGDPREERLETLRSVL